MKDKDSGIPIEPGKCYTELKTMCGGRIILGPMRHETEKVTGEDGKPAMRVTFTIPSWTIKK